MPTSSNPQLEVLALDEFPVREPVSKRAYTCLRLRTRSGVVGFGECASITAADLATLRKAVQAMGGNLSLVAEFPDRAPVVLSGIAEEESTPRPSGRKQRAPA